MTLEEILDGYQSDKKAAERLIVLMNRFKKTGVGKNNVTSLLMAVMLEINKLKKLQGYEKKQLTIDLMNFMIKEIIPGENPIEDVLIELVPTLIDNLASLMNGVKSMNCCLST